MLVLKSLAMLAAAVVVTGQAIDTMPKCAQDCYYASRDGSTECTGADQANMACLCPKMNFFNAVHDCVSKACVEELGAETEHWATTAEDAAKALCATATAGAPAATSAAPANPDASAPPASTPAPETPAGETQPAVSSVPSAVTTEPSTSIPTDAAATSAAAPSTFATSTTENSESATSTGIGAIVPVPTGGSKTSSASAPASTSKDKDENENEDEDEDDSGGGGLSTGAKAGIGAGIGVGSLVLLITAALWIFKKRSAPKDHIKISDPVAGGRHYASDPYNNNNFSRATSQGGITIMSENELEMKSRRYEDMVPRQQPRNMV